MPQFAVPPVQLWINHFVEVDGFPTGSSKLKNQVVVVAVAAVMVDSQVFPDETLSFPSDIRYLTHVEGVVWVSGGH